MVRSSEVNRSWQGTWEMPLTSAVLTSELARWCLVNYRRTSRDCGMTLSTRTRLVNVLKHRHACPKLSTGVSCAIQVSVVWVSLPTTSRIWFSIFGSTWTEKVRVIVQDMSFQYFDRSATSIVLWFLFFKYFFLFPKNRQHYHIMYNYMVILKFRIWRWAMWLWLWRFDDTDS